MFCYINLIRCTCVWWCVGAPRSEAFCRCPRWCSCCCQQGVGSAVSISLWSQSEPPHNSWPAVCDSRRAASVSSPVCLAIRLNASPARPAPLLSRKYHVRTGPTYASEEELANTIGRNRRSRVETVMLNSNWAWWDCPNVCVVWWMAETWWFKQIFPMYALFIEFCFCV